MALNILMLMAILFKRITLLSIKWEARNNLAVNRVLWYFNLTLYADKNFIYYFRL